MDKTNYDIDMLILAASPLVNDINEVPFEWIINVDKEINELLSILLKSKKKIKVTIDILNSENIKKYFSKKIRFCHLSSHGSIEYKYGKKMFYLYGDKVGICEKISKKELIDILDKINNLYIETLFISACHSDVISEILLNYNTIYNVIAINKKCIIDENLIREFAVMFYRNLFINNYNIKSAFALAKAELKTSNSDVYCCCYHDHEDNCPLKIKFTVKETSNDILAVDEKESDEEDYECWNSHDFLHIRQCECNYEESNVHDVNCGYYNNVLKNNKEVICVDDVDRHIGRVCCCNINMIHSDKEKIILRRNILSDIINKKEDNFEEGEVEIGNNDYFIDSDIFYDNTKINVLLKGMKCKIYEIIHQIETNCTIVINIGNKKQIDIDTIMKYISKYSYDHQIIKSISIYEKCNKTKEIVKSKTLFNKSSLLIIPSSCLSFDLSYLSSLYDIILMSSSIPSKNIMQINLN